MALFEVRIAARAIAEIEKISRWWVRNRRASPRLFDHELDAILEMLELQPEIGALKRLPTVGEVRVVVLRRTRYLVAYQVRAVEQQVWIVRVRYGGRRPLLRAR
jgi:plasmid stabilization system protein ParE